jgi:hypothetical protein
MRSRVRLPYSPQNGWISRKIGIAEYGKTGERGDTLEGHTQIMFFVF